MGQAFRFIYFGSDLFSKTVLQSLLRKGIMPQLIVTTPSKKKGRNKKEAGNPIHDLAQELSLPLIAPEDLKAEEFIKKLASYQSDFFFVVSYGKILPESVFCLPKVESLNIHPSLLPLYRGASPIQSMLLNGDKISGVSIIRIEKKLDSGDILIQKKQEISDSADAHQLERDFALLGAELLMEGVEDLLNGSAKWSKQDEEQVTFTRKFTKQDGCLDWREHAFQIRNRIRALNPWPGTYSFLNQKRLKILRVGEVKRAVETKSPGSVISIDKKGPCWVQSGDDLVEIKEMQLEGKKKMSPHALYLGRQLTNGDILTGAE